MSHTEIILLLALVVHAALLVLTLNQRDDARDEAASLRVVVRHLRAALAGGETGETE